MSLLAQSFGCGQQQHKRREANDDEEAAQVEDLAPRQQQWLLQYVERGDAPLQTTLGGGGAFGLTAGGVGGIGGIGGPSHHADRGCGRICAGARNHILRLRREGGLLGQIRLQAAALEGHGVARELGWSVDWWTGGVVGWLTGRLVDWWTG